MVTVPSNAGPRMVKNLFRRKQKGYRLKSV